MDMRDIVNILSKNIFLILFFTLLGMIVGYFTLIQNTDERKFEIKIEIPETNYESIQIFKDISDNLYKIAILEKEQAFVRFLRRVNPNLPIISKYPELSKPKTDFAITVNDINKIIFEYSINPALYNDTIIIYNEKVIKDFPNDVDQKKYIIDNKPTYLSLIENINNRNITLIRVFFAQNYSEYLVENYVKIFLNNVKNHLHDVVLKKIDNTFNLYEDNRSLLENFLIFALDKFSTEKQFFALNFPNFNSKTEFGKTIEDSGIFENKIDLFYESSNIDESFNRRYKIAYLLEKNNGIIWFGILGFLIGVIISFGSNLYFKKSNIK